MTFFFQVNDQILKLTVKETYAVGEVTVLKEDPLSVDLTMPPEVPTATKVLFPNTTPVRVLAV